MKKALSINENYEIYDDGRVYSIKSNKFLKPRKTTQKSGISYYSYDVVDLTNPNKKTRSKLISRLVFFEFGKHNCKSLSELPHISYLDLNQENYHIDNLIAIGVAGVMKKYGIGKNHRFICGRGNSFKIPLEDKEKVRAMLKNGDSKKKIGALFNCSEMAVCRFERKFLLN